MLENRVSWRPRYAVSDDDCYGGTWVRRRFVEAMTGETDGVGGRITALVFETERPAAGAAVAVGA